MSPQVSSRRHSMMQAQEVIEAVESEDMQGKVNGVSAMKATEAAVKAPKHQWCHAEALCDVTERETRLCLPQRFHCRLPAGRQGWTSAPGSPLHSTRYL